MICEEYLYRLENERIAKIEIFNHTLWLSFGGEIIVLNTYVYTLRVNCLWRFSDREKIIFTNQDMLAENHLLDEWVLAFNDRIKKENIMVEFVEINDVSDIKIILSDDMRIDLSVDAENPDELKFISQGNRKLEQNVAYQVIMIKTKHLLEVGALKQLESEKIEKKPNERIARVFVGRAYRLFTEFCRHENLVYMNDVEYKHLWKFKRVTRIKEEKYLEIWSKFKKFDYYKFRKLDSTDFINSQIYRNALILEVFKAGLYGLFREFCKREKLTYVTEITDHYLQKYKGENGIGQKRYLDVLNKLQEHAKELKALETSPFIVGDVYKYIKDLTISEVLKHLEITDLDFVDVKLSEIEGKILKDLTHISKVNHLIDLSNVLSKLKIPKDALMEFKSQLKDREKFVLKLRFLEEKTPAETAQELDIARLRVRRGTKKLKKDLNAFFDGIHLTKTLILISSSQNYVTSENYITSAHLAQILGDENKDILNLLKLSDEPLYYDLQLDIFFFDEKSKINFENKIEFQSRMEFRKKTKSQIEFQRRIDFFLKTLPDVFKFSEHEHVLKEICPTFCFESVYDKYGFHKYGEFYSLRKLPSFEILELVYKYYIAEPIKLDEMGISKIVALARKHLGFEFPNKMRLIDALARRSENLILIDKLTFQWFDPHQVDPQLLEDMFKYLKNEFKTREFVSAEQVYAAFKEQLDEQQIFNKLHMYSIIKYFFSDQITVGKGNSLSIYPDEDNKVSMEEKIVALIEKEGGYTTRAQIQQTTHWAMFRITQAISDSKQIISYKKGGLRLYKSLKLTNEMKNDLLELVSKCMDQGFTTAAVILNEITKVSHLNDFINNYELSDLMALVSFIKILHPKVRGFRLFLYYDDNPEKTFEDALPRIIDGKIDRQGLLNKIQECGYSKSIAIINLNKAVEKKRLAEIDRGIYMPVSQLNIPTEVVEKLKEFIEPQFQNDVYLPLDMIDHIADHLPKIEVEWTASLIGFLLAEHGYRMIQEYQSSYRFDPLILLKRGSLIKNFDELIYTVLTDYEGDFHENAIRRYLLDKGLIREIKFTRTHSLLKHIKNNPEIIRIDEDGIVHLINQGV